MNRREILQSMLALPMVKSVEVANVSPRDVIVLECDRPLDDRTREHIAERMKEVWPDNKCVVLDSSLRLRIAREAPATT